MAALESVELYGRIKVVEASFAARDDALLLRAREGAAEESKTACRAVLADEVVSLHAALRSVTGSVELRLSLCDGQVASAHERLQGLASDVAQGLAQSTEAMRSVTNYKKQAEISRAEATAHTLRKAQEMLETWMARLKDKGEEAVGSSRGAGEGGNWGGGRFDSQESLVAWMEEELSLRSMELSKGLADVDERVKAQALEPPQSVVALKNQIDSLEGYVRQRLSNLPATGASANSENLADLLPQVEGLLERTASRLSGEMKEHVADQLQALQTETAKALESSLADLKSDIADVATAMVELEAPGTPHVRRAQQPETELPEAENEVAGGSRGSSQEPATNRSRLLSLAAARNGQPAASLSGQSREELLAWVKVQVREMMAAETRQRLTRRFSPPGGGPEEPSVAVVELQARLSKVEEKCHELSFEDIDPSAIKSVHLAHLVSEMQRLGARQKTLEQIVNMETGEMMGLDTQRELSELRQLAEGSATDGKREVENVSRVVKGMQRELERAAARGDDVHVAVAKLQGRFDTTMQVILRIVEDLGGDVSALKQTMARDGSGSAAFVSFAAFQEALGAFEDSLQGELGRVREEFLDLLPFKANGGDVTELSIRLEEAFGQIQALAHRISNQAGGVGDDAALFRTPMTARAFSAAAQCETGALQEEASAPASAADGRGDEEGRTSFERARSQLEITIEGLEVQADTLKKALSTAERANEQLQDENRTTADRCRETADKVYALMDSLRLNQVELKKLEAENASRDKKVLSLERQTQNLQAKIAMETDAKVLAEQERKEAEQEAMVLKKKNKKIEDAVTVSQSSQEKAEKEISEFNDRVSTLQTQNAYLASRIDGQEEEKNTLKAEISKVASKSTMLSADNSRLRDEIDGLEEQVATTVNDTESFKKELEYIKREDVLDEAGRQRPILIQSTESDLLEKLQVNEFLYESQQARNPVPPMIEKVAQLLAMLHEGQQRSDAYLADLSKSNGLVSAMRQRNMALFSRTQMFESFKTRALLRYIMNMVEGERVSDLHLDGLSFGQREINEMLGLLQRYDVCEQ
ncbi:unnamed protein product, partial [Polarella glacialis]